MGVTSRGIEYPDPSGMPKRADLETLATSTDAALGGLFKTGRTVVTTNASGVATIAHGLGRVPTFANAGGLNNSTRAAVTSESTTTITVHVVSASTGANFVGNITLRWLVA